MTKKLAILLITATILICFPFVDAQAIPMVDLNVLDSDILVGESFDVEVIVMNARVGDPVPGFDEFLVFDFNVFTSETIFSYDGYMVGADFDDDSDPSDPFNVAGSAFPGIIADEIPLATLMFTAAAAGTDGLQVLGPFDGLFSGLFYESSGFDIDASADIEVSTAAIPEPATMLMVCTGLFGLVGLGRRKRA